MLNGITILKNCNVDYLDPILMDNGLLKVLDCATLRAIPQEHLMIWGGKRGIYTFPTTELIAWLKDRIAGRRAIEICAGNAATGRALGIVRTDSYIQTDPNMVAFYQVINQHPIEPPKDVDKFEANDAVDVFKPKVVVGCYVTQKYLPGDEGPPSIGSSVYGVDELAMLSKIETYINVGNDISHQDKRIRKFKFEMFRFDWIVTRSGDQSKNHICVWDSPYH